MSNNLGLFAKIRNSPLFFLPFFLGGGYFLASLTYSLITQSDIWGEYELPQIAPYFGISAGNSGLQQLNGRSSKASIVWKPDNPYQVTSSVNGPAPIIYLFDSRKTRDYFASAGKNYDLMLAQWHYYFNAKGIKFIDLKDADLMPTLKPGILILPSSVVLNSDERTAIDEFERHGGSVLATWATGSRNGNAELADYDFLHEQFGINVNGEVPAQDNRNFLVISDETPVAFSLPAGYRIWIGRGENNDSPLLVSGGGNVAGRFMSFDRSPNAASTNEAIVYTERGSSRRVYFAFAENSWRFEPANIYTLLDNVFNWLHRRPESYLANWPYPYRSAQIVEMDTEQDFQNAINFSDLLDENGFQGTFYSLTSVAKNFPYIVKHLELKHEIAYHGDVHDAFKGQPKAVQSKRLDIMQQELRPLVSMPARLRGFRPPYELEDQVVESLLFDKGFGHILANSDGTGGMLPYLSAVSPGDFRKGLIVLPRTQRDDMYFTSKGLNSQDIARVMKEDFDQAREYGGLGVLSVHSQNFQPESPVAQAVEQFLAHAKKSENKTWVTSSGNIESWWRNRALFKSKFGGDPEKMQLDITVEKPGIHWKTSLVLTNPAKGVLPKIGAGKDTPPKLVPLDEYRTALVFNPLAPGSYSYSLSY